MENRCRARKERCETVRLMKVGAPENRIHGRSHILTLRLKPDECRPNLVPRMASLHQSPQRFCRGSFDSAIHAHRNPPVNTLGSWAIDRSYGAGRLQGLAAALEWSSPLSSLDTRRIRHIALPLSWACADRNLSRILQRNKPNSKRGRSWPGA